MQAFTLAFGTNIYGYRNLTQSFFTLCRILFGDFDFEELRIQSPFLGPVLFFCFTMLGASLSTLHAAAPPGMLTHWSPRCPCPLPPQPCLCC